jgi:hypothetical protein
LQIDHLARHVDGNDLAATANDNFMTDGKAREHQTGMCCQIPLPNNVMMVLKPLYLVRQSEESCAILGRELATIF